MIVVSAILAFVLVYVLFSYLIANIVYMVHFFYPPVTERICEENGRLTGEWYEYNLSQDVLEAIEQNKRGIIHELWFQTMVSTGKCGPCYVLEEEICDLYARYIASIISLLMFYLIPASFVAAVGGGWIYHLLTKKMIPVGANIR
ncbi:hypothetical protein ACFLZW_04035 [Chloroflexota bacterium]